MATKKGILSSLRIPFLRAIDGARTRGLDLGKVARYQLRHYRICIRFLLKRQQNVFYWMLSILSTHFCNFFIF